MSQAGAEGGREAASTIAPAGSAAVRPAEASPGRPPSGQNHLRPEHHSSHGELARCPAGVLTRYCPCTTTAMKIALSQPQITLLWSHICPRAFCSHTKWKEAGSLQTWPRDVGVGGRVGGWAVGERRKLAGPLGQCGPCLRSESLASSSCPEKQSLRAPGTWH